MMIKLRSWANSSRSRCQVVESTNRLCHSTAGGPLPHTWTRSPPSPVTTLVVTPAALSVIAVSLFASVTEVSVAEV